MTITITLSWFHRKIGPTIYYEYPESNLPPDELTKIPDLMDMKFEEGFFSHSLENLYLFNYFFEVASRWARGHKEMLLMSVCFTNPITTQIQHEILVKCIDFANTLKSTPNVYKSFYLDGPPSGEFPVEQNDEADIVKNDSILKGLLRDLYWNIVSFSREKTEEEITAELLSRKSVDEIIRFLSRGPVEKEIIAKWYTQHFPELVLEEVLYELENQKFIVQNEIEHVTYVLLVKIVKVQRTPPECIITLIQEKPELMELMDEFTERVGNFFNNYKESPEDSKELVKLVAKPGIYDVLLQLRAGPITKDRIINKLDSEPIKNLMDILNVLTTQKIIDEFNYKGELKVLLIDDIQFTTSFPEYLMKFKSKKPDISNIVSNDTNNKVTRTLIKTKLPEPKENSGLENLGEEVFNKLKKISKEKSSTNKEE
ncbi:MAG: hypothetical protein EU530_04340 [Promethearchaeota archaeon]|nr:MAG: hypothetical protein EU530_04340 [Candidatus Lokiarchaeota archaeon]